MTRLVHEILIARAPVDVLAYASSATLWPEWHPSSLRVTGPEGPLSPDATFEEDIRAGGREGHLAWRVLEHVPGRRWVASARGDAHALSLTLTYACHAVPSGTRFERTLEYALSGWTMRVVNHLVLRRRIDRESVDSLARLAHVLESRSSGQRDGSCR